MAGLDHSDSIGKEQTGLEPVSNLPTISEFIDATAEGATVEARGKTDAETSGMAFAVEERGATKKKKKWTDARPKQKKGVKSTHKKDRDSLPVQNGSSISNTEPDVAIQEQVASQEQNARHEHWQDSDTNEIARETTTISTAFSQTPVESGNIGTLGNAEPQPDHNTATAEEQHGEASTGAEAEQSKGFWNFFPFFIGRFSSR